jgi:hypothetical protein
MPLRRLVLNTCKHNDLTPLKGMKLEYLSLYGCGFVQDLRPLEGMPLVELDLYGTRVEDLSPLKGMPLEKLRLGPKVVDLGPLRKLPLTELSLFSCSSLEDLSPLQGLPLTKLHMHGTTKITDVTPLRGLKLHELLVSKQNLSQGSEVLRSMPSLAKIVVEGYPGMDIKTFWKKHDAGEFHPQGKKP